MIFLFYELVLEKKHIIYIKYLDRRIQNCYKSRKYL